MTRLLLALDDGNPSGLETLFHVVYDELRHIAHRHRSRWNGDTTIGTTALVNEAYLKLAAGEKVSARSRLHFMRLASRAMRQVLSNYARNRCAALRGGIHVHVSLDALLDRDAAQLSADDQCLLLLEVDDALDRLQRMDARLKDVVECRFFGGFTTDETAAILGVSSATVRRDWVLARAWLFRELADESARRTS